MIFQHSEHFFTKLQYLLSDSEFQLDNNMVPSFKNGANGKMHGYDRRFNKNWQRYGFDQRIVLECLKLNFNICVGLDYCFEENKRCNALFGK
mmetsp:Transcript_10534/g.10098  ORF Transcript_10534/g.10098 Transcript_10534/m.10098 type:complete len:92 (-) Transcript_10534:256-531(-)